MIKKILKIIKNNPIYFIIYIAVINITFLCKAEVYLSETSNIVMNIVADSILITAIFYTLTLILFILYQISKKKYKRTYREIPAWIYNIEELDVDDGVRVCGAVNNYLSTLELFSKNASENIEEIKSSDIEVIENKLHSLKSIMGMIGAKGLSDKAEKLEEAAINKDITYIEQNIGKFIGEYMQISMQLRPLIDTDNTMKKRMVDRKDIPEIYHHLKEYVENFNDEAVGSMLNALGNYKFPAGEKERFEQLVRAYEVVDWEKMLSLLEDF